MPAEVMAGLDDVLRRDPLPALAAFLGLAAGGLLLARWCRPWLRRARSLVVVVSVVALASLAFALAAAAIAAGFMVFDRDQLGSFAIVLGIAAGFAVLLGVALVRPLVTDVERLGELAVRAEAGDLTVRSGVQRRDELGRTARAVDQMLARLDLLERERAGIEAERRLLLRNIGHDLRSPLAALQVAVEALVDGLAPDPPRYLRSMAHDLAALNTLVEDLFLLGRVEAGRLGGELTTFDLRATLDEAVESLVPIAAAGRVELQLTGPRQATGLGSPEAVARVVRNLVDNALRHSPPDSSVRVGLGPGDSAAWWMIEVVDSGPGFPAGFRERAFDVATRADDARSRDHGGAGLGLAIARGIVRAHGGNMWILPGPGGRVCCTIPAVAQVG